MPFSCAYQSIQFSSVDERLSARLASLLTVWLVVEPPSLKSMKVNWMDSSQYMEKHVPNHQLDSSRHAMIGRSIDNGQCLGLLGSSSVVLIRR